MSAAEVWLLSAGRSACFGGFALWALLFLWTALRQGDWRALAGWNLNRQWAESGRLLGLIARSWPGRLVALMFAIGLSLLILGGLLALIRLFAAGPPA